MNSKTAGFIAITLLSVMASLPARAEFLDPDWKTFSVEGIEAPEWFAGENEGNYIAMCTACQGTMMFQVQVLPDDGTGARVASGVTTA